MQYSLYKMYECYRPTYLPVALCLILYAFISYFICNNKNNKWKHWALYNTYNVDIFLSILVELDWLASTYGIQLFPRKNISVNKDVNQKYNSCSFKGAYLHNCFSRISINEIAIHHVQCVMNKRTSASTCWY